MNKISNIIKILQNSGIDFFTGVPDSVLKPLSLNLSKLKKNKHVITANEGNAVALATGYHLKTKKIAVVYLQNSGLGNIVNPITSLIHKKIYSIPMILFIGWRGSPKIKDEIQHQIQGKITISLLKLLNIKYIIFNKNSYKDNIKKLIKITKKENEPVAMLFNINDLKNEKTITKKFKTKDISNIKRSLFIEKLLLKSKKNKIIATTGYTSRELFSIRNKKFGNSKDFYMVGSMGHASMITLGYSLFTKGNTICLDGDGAFLMHLGAAANIARFASSNFKHILLNNQSHESVGGQPTGIDNINLKQLILGLGYKNYFLIKNKIDINKTLSRFLNSKGPSFLDVRINQGYSNNLPRIKNLNKIKLNFFK